MRSAALALALALSACQVATEGAPCSSSASCPSGQGCGADGRCSARARSCPAPGAALHVDPLAGSDLSETPAPTGALAPAACRFKALAPALAAAAAGPGGAVTVQVLGGTTATPAVFTEALPRLAAGVSLAGGATADGAYVLQLPGPLVLAPGASLSGFVLRPGADGIDAVQVACEGEGESAARAAAVHDVRIEGAPFGAAPARFAAGVRPTGPCAVTVKDSSFDGVAVAVQAKAGGALVVDGCTIARGGRGVWIDGTIPLTATVRDTTIEGGTDTGLEVDQATGSTVTLAGNTIARNCATAQHGGRRAGGVVFLGPPGQLAFTGNRVFGNGFDQVLVDPAGAPAAGAFPLVGAAEAAGCAAEANQLGCYDPQQKGLGVAWTGPLGGVHVQAQGNAWASGVPAQDVDYGAGVDAGAADGRYCPVSPLPCPQPPVSCP